MADDAGLAPKKSVKYKTSKPRRKTATEKPRTKVERKVDGRMEDGGEAESQHALAGGPSNFDPPEMGDTCVPCTMPEDETRRMPGQRGKDKNTRRKRTCKRCLRFQGGDPVHCPGRTGRGTCIYFDENGVSKKKVAGNM